MVGFKDMEARTATSKAGWRKVKFWAKQATADGLEHSWAYRILKMLTSLSAKNTFKAMEPGC